MWSCDTADRFKQEGDALTGILGSIHLRIINVYIDSSSFTTMSSSEEATPTPARPPKNANALPGAGLNTAGGNVQSAGLWDAFRSIRPADFKEVHKKPCVRESFLVGMGAGFGVGGFRTIMGGRQKYKSSPDFADRSSFGTQGLQLGCRYFLLWILLHA